MKPINVLSLFDGMGCLQLVLKILGIKVDKYYASEINPKSIIVAKRNFPNTIQLGDVTKIKGSELPKIFLIAAGSPCQGLSRANTKRKNLKDSRSSLFFQFVRLIQEVKPKYFFLENVKMNQESQDIISKILGVQPIRINNKLVSRQARDRLYWTNIPGIAQPEDRGIKFEDVIGEPGAICGAIRGTKTKYSEGKYLRMVYARKDGKCNCLTTNRDMHMVLREHVSRKLRHEVPFRHLTISEMEKIQGVPVNYTSGVAESHRVEMLGNGWNIPTIVHLLSNLKSCG